jgi:hypothetical protein
MTWSMNRFVNQSNIIYPLMSNVKDMYNTETSSKYFIVQVAPLSNSTVHSSDKDDNREPIYHLPHSVANPVSNS